MTIFKNFMKTFLKRFIKFFGRILVSQKWIRFKLRRLISSSNFLDAEFRYKLRGALESVAPEEILESGFLDCKFYYPNKSVVGLYASECGFWDDFSILFDVFLTKAETIIEIGSNIGVDTIFMAKKVSPNCKIIAFEPCDKYRSILEKNIKENNLKNVLTYNYFLSSKSNSKIDLHITSSSASIIKNGSKSFPATDKQICKSITLDDFFQKFYPSSSLDFLKVDTDGWDQKVIEGGMNTIIKFKPFLFVEFSGYLLQKAGDSNVSFAELLHRLGYNDFFLFKEKMASPIRISGHKELLEFLIFDSSSDVFAIPSSKINNFLI